jgi:D-sedoheptulose 7-phosphate isomerase
MTHFEQFRAHFDEHAQVVSSAFDTLAAEMEEYATRVAGTIGSGGRLFFCGNGGSAADAQHLAAEYVVRFTRERRAVGAVALTTDTSVLTAACNDLGFDDVFARQIEALGSPGDLLILHSTSGMSPNLLAAADTARSLGVETIGLLARGGGALAGKVDLALVVPTDSTARAQELHLLIGHAVCDVVEASLPHD